MNFATLKSLKPDEFESAADGYKKASDMASSAKDRVEQEYAAKMQAALEGEAVEAAAEQLRKLGKNFHYVQVECGLASTALNGLAFDFRAAKKKLDAALADVSAEKFTTNPDGSVTYPAAGEKVDGRTPEGGTVTGRAANGHTGNPIDPGGDADDAASAIEDQAARFDPNPNRGRAQGYANRIAQAVKEATDADEKWAPKLRRLKADDDLDVSHGDWVDANKDMQGVRKGAEAYLDKIEAPPKGGTPKENADWWQGLSAEDQDAYISMHPASVGAMDGVPAEVRDEANRTVLAEKRAAYQTELNALPSAPKGPWRYLTRDPFRERRGELEEALKGMDAIQKRFDRTGRKGLPEAYLLGFDPKGAANGRIILASGNPDTADHTATYVPGTYTDIKTIGKDIERTDNLWQESTQHAPNQSTSTIMWFDYDAPDNPVTESPSRKYADEGGPVLRQFLDGNEVAHHGATGHPSHTTVIGHSYGSVVVADAAIGKLGGDPLADDIIAAGSPGMRVKNPEGLGVDRDHMWAAEADGPADWATRHFGRFVHGGGVPPLVPSDSTFGANQLDSDAAGHGGYWDPESRILSSQAAIIAGRYERAELQ
ncbi:alpha/beta hydrolase [Streptomyces armeniacus]|uniref:alpha/beta hydrolase n=1 Tax=Streptomyces armeniacus TaxID=83291 RepID=UPI001FE87EA6|nr:alpha/beta hydrolase [Streptomyces armeniacus]